MLIDAKSKKPAVSVFVRAGETASVKVPLGTFEVRYASGRRWEGDAALFGPRTAFSRAEKIFTFEKNATHVTGFTLTLFEAANGNLHSAPLSREEFLGHAAGP